METRQPKSEAIRTIQRRFTKMGIELAKMGIELAKIYYLNYKTGDFVYIKKTQNYMKGIANRNVSEPCVGIRFLSVHFLVLAPTRSV